MLYIISNFESALTQFIFAGLQRDDVRLIQYHSKPATLAGKLTRWLEVQFPKRRLDWYYPAALRAQLDGIGPGDSVLIFALGNTKDMVLLGKYLHGKQVHAFLWNPVLEHNTPQGIAKALERLTAIEQLTPSIYSFDRADVAQYGLLYAPQPFRHMEAGDAPAAAQSPPTDFFFLGYDKGRLPLLMRLKQAADTLGLSCHFHILPDAGKTYSAAEQAMLSTGYLSYADNMALSQRARCLIDIVQATQSGATMRSVEALFLNKKLITTRQLALQEPDYNPSRTLVVDSSTAIDCQALLHFMQSPFVPASDAIRTEHEINTWLNRFI
ncbi:hypothetical protein E8K88_00215 [Lampropedia aestuarii]|uniref:Lipopolysaccharide biosynthesis protein n=1 Tax=Lampropedia aestuarii TaxID=2562762 RepID=A0A4S5BYI0_9BURK|nr:hypothetical protein [Lampropedia aestuarii]THJ36371.1 hypothetical protein E8K88_00215 [Lampropedia aestuarii]